MAELEYVETNELGQQILDAYAELATAKTIEEIDIESELSKRVKQERLTGENFRSCSEQTLASIGREVVGYHFHNVNRQENDIENILHGLIRSLLGRTATIRTLDGSTNICLLKSRYSKNDKSDILQPWQQVAQATGKITYNLENSLVLERPEKFLSRARQQVRAQVTDEMGRPLIAVPVES